MRLTLLLICSVFFIQATTGMIKKGSDTIRIDGRQAYPRPTKTESETKILNNEMSRLKISNLSQRQRLKSVTTKNHKYAQKTSAKIRRGYGKKMKIKQHINNVVKKPTIVKYRGLIYSYMKGHDNMADEYDYSKRSETNTKYEEIISQEPDIFTNSDPELNGICPHPYEVSHICSQPNLHLLSERRDKFTCSARCMCQWTNTEHHRQGVVAYCNDKTLHSFPRNLPKSTIKIRISDNKLFHLYLSTIYLYQSLRYLIATNCSIYGVFPPKTTATNPLLTELDLSNNRIEYFVDGVFVGLPNLCVLRLTGNKIQYVKNSFFRGLGRLKMLSLSQNNILRIDSNAFDVFSNLYTLDLAGNSVLGYENLTPDLFKGMKRLKTLMIQGCSYGAKDYPNEAIGALQNLETLKIDALAFPAEFKSEFATLKKLRNLYFGPEADCRLNKMPESFFQYVPNITCLFFHSCNLTINPKAYGSFKKLKALTIEKIPVMTLDNAFEHLEEFKTKSLEYIGFKNLTNWKYPCIWLEERQGKSMKGFNNLTVINLSENRLSLLADSFIQTIPLKTEKLILRKNKFDLINILWTTLIRLTNLTYLDVSIQNQDLNILYFPSTFEIEHSRSISKIKEQNERLLLSSHVDHWTNKLKSDEILPIPQNLKTVKASKYHLFGNIILSNKIGKNSLKSLNFSSSGLIEWGKGRLPKDVEIVDLSVNSATHIDNNFFHPNNSLQRLYLQINFLGEFIGNANFSIFEHLANLTYLDLRTNVIYAIPYEFFKGLKNVQTIRLENNRLETLNVSFENTPNLKFLDLHKNSLSWISKASRDQMDKLEGLVVDLHYNSFQCNCDSIDLLRWMAMTRVYFLNIKLYTCHNLDNSVINLDSRRTIKIKVDYLMRHCSILGYLTVVCVVSGFVFVFLVIAGFVYKKRWWIRYKFHVLCAKKFGYKPRNHRNLEESCHVYDAFLLYAPSDRHFALKCSKELEKKRHHNLCIRDRDIVPGTSELAAIVGFIQNSRFTLVVVTDNFIKEMDKNFQNDPMTEHAIQMALMEEYCTSRKTLHLMMCSSSENANYPYYILKVLRDQNVTSFPSANDEQIVSISLINTFWDRISDVIGHTRERKNDNNGWNYNSYHDDGDL